jgi:hypothetical protein
MYMYGGWCNSVTGCTGRDYMPNTYDTCMGRFYTVTAYGNRQENIYIGGNRTYDLTVQPTHFNQNSGEQIMWEDMPITSTQKPAAVDRSTLSFDKPIKGKVKWHSDAIVVAGRGMGQFRRIQDYDKSSGVVTVARPWDVLPDIDSTIMIGRPVRRIVVYGNQLDGKPRAPAAEHHIASAGVEPFGASIDVTVVNNTFHELRSGIATFSPAFFHYYADNRCETVRTGIRWGGGTAILASRNLMKEVLAQGYWLGGSGSDATPLLDVVEHGTSQSIPLFLNVGNRWGKPTTHRKAVVYGNRASRGSAPREGASFISTPTPEQILMEANVAEGF